MAATALVTVGTTALPQPSSYNASTATIVDGGRNVEGVQVGSVVRDDIYKIELEWKFLTDEQWAEILQLFRIASGGAFINSVTFYAQDLGGWVTKDMYVNDRTAGMRWIESDDTTGWLGCKLNLIEV